MRITLTLSSLFNNKGDLFALLLLTSIITIGTQPVSAETVHAFYADEHNDHDQNGQALPTGNRILEIDLDTMSLVNSLDVPGLIGHHADNGFNSKIYGVPKGSNFVNVIELEKDSNGTTSMELTKQINLIHKPRSGDAYNQKFNVILMVASNRPMGSFINIETDEVVGTIGENVDCTLTDGTKLLSHADANTIAGATKYHCANSDHGGNQISGHPYWLTPDYAAIVDRSNRQISVYKVWKEGNTIKSQLINHLKTRTSVHQIVPRDRTNLPSSQQADFYATEEGNTGTQTSYGIPEALIKMKLTTNGLQLVRRIDLQRAQATDRVKSDRILQACKDIYFKDRNFMYPSSMWFNAGNRHSNRTFEERRQEFQDLFTSEGILPSQTTSQHEYIDFPIECLHTAIPGGHNADFAPDNRLLHVGMAGGMMSVIDVNQMKIINNVDAGAKSGPGHTCFSKKHNVGIVTNHKKTHHRIVAYYDVAGMLGRPTDGGRIELNNFNIISKEGLTDTYQSHTCYIDESGDYYYNFFTDGGVFYKIDLKAVADWAYGRSRNRDFVVDSLYTGGVPIQGSFISLDSIKSNTPTVVLEGNNDTASSNGDEITINVLDNDIGTGLTITEVDAPGYGNVTFTSTSLSYTPNQGYSGTDSFWYKITDSRGWYTWAEVTITVTSTRPPTIFEAYADATSSNGSAIVIDVLNNDKGNGLTITEVENPGFGTATIVNNMINYQPNSGSTGVDEFWYRITDSRGWYTWGQVLVTVSNSPQPSALEGVTDNVTTSASEVIIDVMANDLGDGLTLTAVDPADHGTTSIENGKIKYQPPVGFTGTDEFWYQITDSRGWYTWGQVLITVN